ncbi:maleylpyruvate isomerase family mycothiol-dependent enzyme [Pilimelia columellifera]|uniref:Maleylpyruvate isomerase family mycothiol-dependent enzyme n=1 Tax=Pilimelia columellifera subsp. columellifera TaxID=706583 RepID=A0ABP6AQN9_9ACTN
MHRLHGDKEFWLAGLRAEGAAFRAAATTAPPDVVVPGCPGWTVETLTAHLGSFYSWVRQHVERGVTEPPSAFADHRADVPAWPATLSWWDDEHLMLMSCLEPLDPTTPAWNWAPQAKKAGFWFRRTALDTAVHRWDLQSATGAAQPIESKLAADGVSEILDTWLPAGRRQGPTDLNGVVHLVATDLAQEWYVRLRGEGISLLDTDTILDTDDHHPRAHAAGAASDLLLSLFGRVPSRSLAVTGDASLLGALHAG